MQTPAVVTTSCSRSVLEARLRGRTFKGGFIAFTSLLIISAVALAIAASISLLGVDEAKSSLSFKKGQETLKLADNLVYIGFAFLTLGLLFGALWAKEAWGHYWTWDPKEVWAFLTWMGYLIYIHYRHFHPQKTKQALGILALAFIVLLVCWFGVNYLPVANTSVHTYTQY